jgi:hypothetical protein
VATAKLVTDWVRYSSARPVYYVYGTGGNVVYRDTIVYVDGQRYATADEYYQQASDLADAAPEIAEDQADKIEWLPLGVFAYTQKGVSETNTYLQLAVTKDGVIGGTLFNEATNTSRPLEGTVDKKTQRAAWTFADGKNTDTVMETSIYSLTKDKAPALVHFGPKKTQEVELVRMEEPKDSDKTDAPAPAAPKAVAPKTRPQ